MEKKATGRRNIRVGDLFVWNELMFVQPACFAAALTFFVICAQGVKANDLPSGGHLVSAGNWGFGIIWAETTFPRDRASNQKNGE